MSFDAGSYRSRPSGTEGTMLAPIGAEVRGVRDARRFQY